MKKRIEKIKIRGKVIKAEICDNVFSKARGLMFRKKSMPLLFVFKKPTKTSIHSLFCRPFRAIWLNKNRIIDEKIIDSWSISIKPKSRFTELVEIPLKNNDIALDSRR